MPPGGADVAWWKGNLLLPGIFDGEHYCVAPSATESTEFIHGERFSGQLVPLLRRALDRETRSGFEAMNRALKQRVEQGGSDHDRGDCRAPQCFDALCVVWPHMASS
jgi:hypothetical protein